MVLDLINGYYEGIARKGGWERALSDSFRFISPGGAVIKGKAAYVQANSGFLRGVQKAQRKELLTDGETACVWMNYQIDSPAGKQTSLDAVEIWTAEGDQLSSLTIYFDTAAFRSFMQGR